MNEFALPDILECQYPKQESGHYHRRQIEFDSNRGEIRHKRLLCDDQTSPRSIANSLNMRISKGNLMERFMIYL